VTKQSTWAEYACEGLYDELMQAPGEPRPASEALASEIDALGPDELAARQLAAEASIKEMGITFTVYSEEGGMIDRAWPFDVIPRVIPEQEWRRSRPA
jgi:uncharacterized circularly permuted ATP-grasp superfamily protein